MTADIVAAEGWANPVERTIAGLDAPAIVPAGAAAVAPGTEETWAMGGRWNMFPAVRDTAYPPGVLRVFDLAAPPEIIRVRDSTTATWLVVRGDQDTVPVAHRPGFAVRNAVTAAGLAGLAQGLPSGNGLILPRAARRSFGVTGDGSSWNGAALRYAVFMTVPGGEAGRGAVYEATAWGYYHSNNFPDPFGFALCWGDPVDPDLGITTTLGGPVTLDQTASPAVQSAAPARWRMHAMVHIYDGEAHGQVMLHLADRHGIATPNGTDPGVVVNQVNGANTYLGGPQFGPVPVETTRDQQFGIAAAMTKSGGGQLVATLGGWAWKSA